ncbi:hypothetical protein GCM10010349_79510 [Streptomyces flavofungini]|uniref:Transposase IS4-like domain-containing protein n=1 Tax=Streptomyces flavofungini TaxID=68200 RepID=A0ABS0XJA5_9ACTN|nr:transposase [Streptomyces flavofungini]MBJ3813303.1 hypothetical protein [Streptomyces flavofungini]GHC91211.1 hypothetical protein GCM10010349_79510 [Streptomyces flavofungini]
MRRQSATVCLIKPPLREHRELPGTAARLAVLPDTAPASRTVSQLRVPDKTNEITAFTTLLAPFGLTGTVVSADALHTQREHTTWLVEEKNAHYLLVVKGNQPKLHAAVKTLP